MEENSKEWLEANGFDGLLIAGECGCELSDLRPCGEDWKSCTPGYKHMDPRPEHEGDWAIWTSKEEPEDDGWENVGY